MKKLLLVVLLLGLACTSRANTISGSQVSDAAATREYLLLLSNSTGTMLQLRESELSFTKPDTDLLTVTIGNFSKMLQDSTTQKDGQSFMAALNAEAGRFLSGLSNDGKTSFLAFLAPRKRWFHVADPEHTAWVTMKAHLTPAAYQGPGSSGSGCSMQVNYSDSGTQWLGPSSTDSTKASIYTQTMISGYTYTQGRCGGYHQASATLVINGVGGTNYGQASSPQSYISAYNTVESPMNSFGDPVGGAANASDGATVYCSLLGYNIFADFPFGSLNLQIEPAFTLVQDTGDAQDQIHPADLCNDGKTPCHYFTVGYFCSTASQPPDWQPGILHVPSRQNFTLGATACLRDQGVTGWLCIAKLVEYTANFAGLLKYTSLSTPYIGVSYDCTNWDKHISGWPPLGSGIPIWPWF